MPLQTGEKTLHQIVSTVASSLELTEVLKAVVRLMSEASGVHACFAYLVEDDGARLVLRAASPPYGRQVGKVALERGEGLAWWAAERGEPAFIRENALADPRVKYVPELEEERFQSLLAVPIVGRAGEAIGVIMAHTEAPREFSDASLGRNGSARWTDRPRGPYDPGACRSRRARRRSIRSSRRSPPHSSSPRC